MQYTLALTNMEVVIIGLDRIQRFIIMSLSRRC